MISFLIGFFSVILILVSIFITLIVLMQRPSANAGMGSSLGAGIAESAFGGESSNVLTRYTIYAIVGFFILSFGLYLASMNRFGNSLGNPHGALPDINVIEQHPLPLPPTELTEETPPPHQEP